LAVQIGQRDLDACSGYKSAGPSLNCNRVRLRNRSFTEIKQELIFVVGCPRSGTTWLQLLLSQHPAIATLQETHLFPDYISPAFARWRSESQKARETGLTSLMSHSQFLDLWRQFAEETLRVALVDKPNAAFILEKTPVHIHHGCEILELFPTAYFIHIIRDPRAVVASLLDASRSWGRNFAPQTSLPAAEMWRAAVLDGRRIGTLTKRYMEVSYEVMLQRPEVELARVIKAIGLDPDPGFCQRAAETCAAANISGRSWKAWVPKSMENIKGNTVRKGEAEGWRKELTRFQVTTVEYLTRELLNAYGYTPEGRQGTLSTLRLRICGLLARCGHRIGRRLRGAIRALK
jgi:Sulfotransferase family